MNYENHRGGLCRIFVNSGSSQFVRLDLEVFSVLGVIQIANRLTINETRYGEEYYRSRPQPGAEVVVLRKLHRTGQ